MGKKPTVEITIPVYNEEQELADSMQTLTAFMSKHMTEYDWKVVIADNASTDTTYRIAQSLAKRNARVDAVHLTQKGRGRAVKYVWTRIPADFHVYMDVDLSSDLKHLPNLVHALERGYDIAIGSRNARGARVYGRNTLRTITSKGYIFLVKVFFWVHFTDAQCGFKAVTKEIVREVLPRVEDTGWFFDSELLILAEKSGYRIYDEPVTWIDNPGSTVRVWRTAQGDLAGLWRLFRTRPWRGIKL